MCMPIIISVSIDFITFLGLDFDLETRSLSRPGCLSVNVDDDESVEGNEVFIIQWTVNQQNIMFSNNNSLTTVTIRDSSCE